MYTMDVKQPTQQQYKKENHPKLPNLQLWGFCQVLQEGFATALVNKPSPFEPLKFYCIFMLFQVNLSMLSRYILQMIGSLVLMFTLNAALTGVLLAVVPVVSLCAVQYGMSAVLLNTHKFLDGILLVLFRIHNRLADIKVRY